MPNSNKKRVSKEKNADPKTKAKNRPSPPPPEPASGNSRFVNDLLVRGEAAELGKDGKLPLPATHIIKKKNPDGTVEVKRARFKLF